jgi:hypothetical protein
MKKKKNENKIPAICHAYNIEDAKKYGIISAVLVYNIKFWLMKNLEDNTNIYDGKVWTFNSVKKYQKDFPEFTERQISYNLKKLEKLGVLIVGNFNKKRYDKTKWYTVPVHMLFPDDKNKPVITDSEKPTDKIVKSYCQESDSIQANETTDLQNCQMDVTNLSIPSDEIVKPIPDINTDINSVINNSSRTSTSVDTYSTVEFANANSETSKEMSHLTETFFKNTEEKEHLDNITAYTESAVSAFKEPVMQQTVVPAPLKTQNIFTKELPEFLKYGIAAYGKSSLILACEKLGYQFEDLYDNKIFKIVSDVIFEDYFSIVKT